MSLCVNTRIIRQTLIAILLLMGVACAWAADLNGAGATFPYPIYSKWFDVYGQKPTGARINYASIGSGGGIKQLMAGTVDFGASDAPLSDAEVKAMPSPVVHIPTVAGAVVVAYNLPQMDKGIKLTPEALSGIFLGTITKWDDPQITKFNPTMHLPDMPITVIHRSDGSGTTYIYTHYLAAVSGSWATKVGSGKSVNWPVGLGGKGNEGVAGLIEQAPGSIGYVELAYAVQNKLPYAFMRNKAGVFVEPSIASTAAAAANAVPQMKHDVRVSIVNSSARGAYPICGFTYILLYKNQTDRAKGATLVNFLNWAMHDGQTYAPQLLYVPLPKPVIALNEAALRTVVYAGKPLLK